MKELPIQQQIEVLENARASLIKHRKAYIQFGLCFHISEALLSILKNKRSEEDFQVAYRMLSCYIPLFNLQNAYQFGADLNAGNTYWWPCEKLQKRLAFLDWMINELKQQL